jgi:hypothetical protein
LRFIKDELLRGSTDDCVNPDRCLISDQEPGLNDAEVIGRVGGLLVLDDDADRVDTLRLRHLGGVDAHAEAVCNIVEERCSEVRLRR